MFEQLLDKYLSSFEDKIKQVNKALKGSDLEGLYLLVHRISGSSGSYGIDAVHHQSTKLESLIKKSESVDEQIREQGKKLIQLMRDVAEMLR